ncbi:MAG: hypothetical protein HKN29_13600 [Rhodothermales bacterium]|nr:hypothetical protein [Rhodothermales bacterium]
MADNKHRQRGNKPATRRDGDEPSQSTRPDGFSMWQWQGAIAHPDDMERYKLVDPALPAEIVGMAKNQAAHRQHVEKAIFVGMPKRSQWMAFLLALAMIFAGTFLITQGNEIIGSATMIAAIASMLTALFRIIGSPGNAGSQVEGRQGTRS